MSRQKSLKRLSKFIIYALGRKPDEFGLVLDPDGFVKLKEFLRRFLNPLHDLALAYLPPKALTIFAKSKFWGAIKYFSEYLLANKIQDFYFKI